MKKKYLLFFVLLSFLPFSVRALEVDTRLDCDSKNIKKKDTIKCSIKANIQGGSLSSFSGVINDSSSYVSFSNSSFDESGLELTGDNQTLVTFQVTAGDSEGIANLKVSNMNGKDENGNAVSFKQNDLSYSLKVLNDRASINDIKLDGESISGFSATHYSYDFSVSKKEVEITANKSVDSTLTGDGVVSLKCGENQHKIKVVAEDGTDKTYTLNINRTCSDVTTLKGITLSSGVLSPKFDANTKSYTVAVSKDIDSIIITPIKDNEGQVVSGDIGEKNLVYGKNEFKIEVVSESEETTTYTVIVNREDGRDNNCFLKSLSLSDGKIMFERDKFEYSTSVLYGVKSIEVIGEAESDASKVTVSGNTNLSLGENIIVVTVTSEQEKHADYKIRVKRLNAGETLGDNANLSSLEVSGYKIKFDPDNTEYFLEIKNENKLNIAATLEDSSSVYKVVGNENLKNKSVIKIIVEALDGTTKTYKLVIKKNDNTVPLIIICASVVISTGLIVYVILQGKKNNKKFSDVDLTVTDNLDNKTRKKEKKQRVKKENKGKVKKEKKNVKKIDTNILIDEDKEILDRVDRQLKLIEDNNDDYELEQYVPNNVIKEAVVQQPEEIHDDTKICSLCGHSVPYELDVCPYCKKKF